jgi:hypothetical protein
MEIGVGMKLAAKVGDDLLRFGDVLLNSPKPQAAFEVMPIVK